jgi:hypothetical protein
MKIQRLGTLASAQRLANEPVAAAESLIALDRLLDNDEARLLNQVSVITTLSALSSDTLRDLARSASGCHERMGGNCTLARTRAPIPPIPDPLSPGTVQAPGPSRPSGLARPMSRCFPEATPRATASRSCSRAAAVSRARQPRSRTASRPPAARTPAAAARTRDRRQHQRARARSIHAKAVEGGADYVLGPLEKESVDSLAAGPALAVPTLALNQTTRDSQAAANLFQFALSPENEAAEAANKAASMGLKRAPCCIPKALWGARLASAFRTQWRRLGGTVGGGSRLQPDRTQCREDSDRPSRRRQLGCPVPGRDQRAGAPPLSADPQSLRLRDGDLHLPRLFRRLRRGTRPGACRSLFRRHPLDAGQQRRRRAVAPAPERVLVRGRQSAGPSVRHGDRRLPDRPATSRLAKSPAPSIRGRPAVSRSTRWAASNASSRSDASTRHA